MQQLLNQPGPVVPVFALDLVTSWQAKVKQDGQEELDDEEKSSSRLCCRQCQHPITDHRASLEMLGGHVHEFTNPGGYEYQIALYNQADCITHGPAMTEFTWFAGYAWQLALCSSCHAHLGWRYQRVGLAAFYGLIRDRLVEIHRN